MRYSGIGIVYRRFGMAITGLTFAACAQVPFRLPETILRRRVSPESRAISSRSMRRAPIAGRPNR
jgi:hypothetical protein